ncbi:MAG: universal stress protein [Sulfobacillus thermosulfidooxidans]|nr:MAG: universal stress protein [Sulfobacillus thermosulfidooxidans]
MEPVVVEVKSILKQGLSLFSHMMQTVNALKPGQTLIVKSTFQPRPLISQMRRRGYTVTQEKIGRILVTTFTAGQDVGQNPSQEGRSSSEPVVIQGAETFLDNRELVPPDPMQRTLAKLEELPAGSVLVIHNDRVPVFLLSELDDQGYPYETQALDDGSAIVRILKTH